MKKTLAFSIFLMGIWLLLLNDSFGLGIVRTSQMVTDNEAQRGMRDLLHLLKDAGITITPLKDALNSNTFHQEVSEANGLTLAEGNEGVTFKPGLNGPFSITPYSNTLVDVVDPFTRII